VIEKLFSFFDNKNKRCGMKSMDKPKTADKKNPRKHSKKSVQRNELKKKSKENE